MGREFLENIMSLSKETLDESRRRKKENVVELHDLRLASSRFGCFRAVP